MLQLIVPGTETYNPETNEFSYSDQQVLQLEHSLLSLSKWESKWCKAFLTKKEKSAEEIKDYVRCMTINKNVDPTVYDRLTSENYNSINAYISAKMTATYIKHPSSEGQVGGDTVTSELIYFWMITYGIPFECQKWHLNRLLALIDVCRIKTQPQKKMSRSALAHRNSSLNAARRAKYHTRG